MLKKTVYVTTLALAVGATALPAAAGHRSDDRAAGAIIGGIAGAAIGNQVDRGEGAVVGGIIGALAGASIADSGHRSYRHDGYRYGYGGGYRHDHRRYAPSGYRGAYNGYGHRYYERGRYVRYY